MISRPTISLMIFLISMNVLPLPLPLSPTPFSSSVDQPFFLRSCLNSLRAESAEQVDVALSALPSLVSKEPGDLPEVASNLLTVVLHLNDQYALEVPLVNFSRCFLANSAQNFSEKREAALISLIKHCPRVSVPTMLTDYFQHSISLGMRLEILRVRCFTDKRLLDFLLQILSSGAKSLASFGDEMDTPDDLAPKQVDLSQNSSLLFTHEAARNEIQTRLERKTRRWASRQTKSKAKENRFAQHAHLFFPLIHGTADVLSGRSKPMENLMHALNEEDGLILAHTLYAGAAFLSLSSLSRNNSVEVKSMLEIVYVARLCFDVMFSC